MKSVFYGLFAEAKSFYSDRINKVLTYLVIISVMGCYGFFVVNNKLNNIADLLQQSNKVKIANIENEVKRINVNNAAMLEAIIKLEKKVDFRYFNLTRSLEDIHNVKIETHKGHLEN